MGNERWALRTVSAEITFGGTIVELGAGEGHLCRALHKVGFRATGCDLVPRPSGLPESIRWKTGDIRDSLATVSGDAAVAVLFLHHFDDATLRSLGHTLQKGFRKLVVCEPHRHRMALGQGALLLPFVNGVTRHDMMASIRAGFRPGELPERLGLTDSTWEWKETTTLRGALRMIARRKTK